MFFWELFWSFQEHCFLAVFYDTLGRLLLKQENTCSPMNSLFLYLIVPFSFVRSSLFVKCYLTGGIITINENFIDNFIKVRFYCKSAQVTACFWIFIIKKCTLDGHLKYKFHPVMYFYHSVMSSFYLDMGSFHSVMGSLNMLFLFDYAVI